MAISEAKMQIVIANYFKDECDVNTSIRQAFEKGFRIGVKKGASTNRPQGKWKAKSFYEYFCNNCGFSFDIMKCEFLENMKYCPNCGVRKGADDE